MRENPQTKQEFLDELARYMGKLPQNELEDALSYYAEYIDEAGEENLAETLASLGHPREIAVRILSERTALQIEAQPPSAAKGFWSVWTVILAVFAAPIALPLAIGAAALIFAGAVVLLSLLIAAAAVLASLVITVGALFVGLGVGGLAHLLIGIVVLPQSIVSGLFFIGGGACCMGLGVACFPLLLWLGKKVGTACARLFGHYFPKWVSAMIPQKRRAEQ